MQQSAEGLPPPKYRVARINWCLPRPRAYPQIISREISNCRNVKLIKYIELYVSCSLNEGVTESEKQKSSNTKQILTYSLRCVILSRAHFT